MSALPSFASIRERVEYLRAQPVAERVDVELDMDVAAEVRTEASALCCAPEELVAALLHMFMERYGHGAL